jgi:hypothetical protein
VRVLQSKGGCSARCTHLYALFTFRMPPPSTALGLYKKFTRSVAVLIRQSLTCAAVAAGNAFMSSSAAPATWGEACKQQRRQDTAVSSLRMMMVSNAADRRSARMQTARYVHTLQRAYTYHMPLLRGSAWLNGVVLTMLVPDIFPDAQTFDPALEFTDDRTSPPCKKRNQKAPAFKKMHRQAQVATHAEC